MARQKPAGMTKNQVDATERKRRAAKAKETRAAKRMIVALNGDATESYNKVGDIENIKYNNKDIEFEVKKVKGKKQWVRRRKLVKAPCPQGKVRNVDTGRCIKVRPVKIKQESCPEGQYLRKGFCVKKPARKKVVQGPCPSGKVKSVKTGRCIKGRPAKKPTTKRGKRAMITRKAREYVEKKFGKAANHIISKRVTFTSKEGKKYMFVVRKVKGKKHWVRVAASASDVAQMNRKKKAVKRAYAPRNEYAPRRKRLVKDTGLPKVKPTSIDPLFSDLGDLPGAPAELRM